MKWGPAKMKERKTTLVILSPQWSLLKILIPGNKSLMPFSCLYRHSDCVGLVQNGNNELLSYMCSVPSFSCKFASFSQCVESLLQWAMISHLVILLNTWIIPVRIWATQYNRLIYNLQYFGVFVCLVDDDFAWPIWLVSGFYILKLLF